MTTKEDIKKPVASLSEMLTANITKYDTVDAHGITYGIGSLCSADMIEWFNENNDKEMQRFAGLRLLVKSLVDGEGNRIAVEAREAAVETFKHKDAGQNSKLIAAVMKLNGLDRAAKALEAIKNASGETTTVVSPSDSPSPAAD